MPPTTVFSSFSSPVQKATVISVYDKMKPEVRVIDKTEVIKRRGI